MTEEFEIRKQLADAARDSEIEGKCDFNATPSRCPIGVR